MWASLSHLITRRAQVYDLQQTRIGRPTGAKLTFAMSEQRERVAASPASLIA
jgi:hypothetical protein